MTPQDTMPTLSNLSGTEFTMLIAWVLMHLGGLFAVLRAWVHSAAARELAHETLDALLIDLREDIADAVAEGSAQVITQLKAHAAGPVKQ